MMPQQQQQQEVGLTVNAWISGSKSDQQQPQQQPPWYGRSFLQENDIIARALQVELSSPWIKTSAGDVAAASLSELTKTISSTKPELGQHNSSIHSILPDWMQQKPALSMSAAVGVVGSKVNKRRSRAANKTPITFLSADASNFRAMVQKLTGIPASPVPLIMQQQHGAIKNELHFWSNSNTPPLPPFYHMQPAPHFPQNADNNWQLNPNPSHNMGESLIVPTPSWPAPTPSTFANSVLVSDMATTATWPDGSMASHKIELAHSA